MVKDSISRLMFLVLGLVAIFLVCRVQIVETPHQRLDRIIAQKRFNYTVDIKAEELESFIKIWPEYKKLGLDKNFYVPYLSVLPEQASDLPRKMWFYYHHWDANRFFYVQQRLVYLLQALDIKRDAQAIINLLEEKQREKQAQCLIQHQKSKKETPEDILINQMIELQKQRIQGADMYFSELIIISAKEKQLRELLQ